MINRCLNKFTVINLAIVVQITAIHDDLVLVALLLLVQGGDAALSLNTILQILGHFIMILEELKEANILQTISQFLYG